MTEHLFSSSFSPTFSARFSRVFAARIHGEAPAFPPAECDKKRTPPARRLRGQVYCVFTIAEPVKTPVKSRLFVCFLAGMLGLLAGAVFCAVIAY